jgi:uncharacterized protein (UPF0335 family)
MDVLEILNTIKEEWVLLVFVFTMGGIWWQGKEWFKKVTEQLDKSSVTHTEQNMMLQSIYEKTERLEDRTDKIEHMVNSIHEELHEQEIELAVLKNSPRRRSASKS